MIVEHKADLRSLEACLPPFLELVGAERWEKRTAQLSKAAIDSPLQAKIIADYHWLEVILSRHIGVCETDGNATPSQITVELLSALYFVQTVLSVHSSLSPAGRKILE
jgi:hypothetical protein